MDDVIIIGGSFAGLAAALQLGRARRKVTVLDTGLPRNRFTGHSHGLPGHDHKRPLDILAEARQQLARYPTIRLFDGRADSISGAIDDFSVLTADGESLGACRLILSYGVADQMPDRDRLSAQRRPAIVEYAPKFGGSDGAVDDQRLN